MENLKKVFKFCILGLATGLMLSCNVLQQAVEKPSVVVKEVKYRGISLREGKLDSRIQVRNPNAFPIPLRKLTYNLKLNGRMFINSSLDYDKNIPAQGTIELHVPIRFQYRTLVKGITSLLTQHDIKYQLAGKLDLGLLDIPFSKTGNFALKF